MKFKISKDILDAFPEMNIGVVIVRNATNSVDDSEIISQLREEEERAKKEVSEPLSENGYIECWRKAYSWFGAHPKKYRSSIEALLRSILKGRPIPKINPIVDIYNLISIKHKLPIGGEDIDKIEGDLLLCRAEGTEPFVPLGSDSKEMTEKGEVVYKDDKEVLCRRWNWRESDTTKITPESKNVIIVVEALPPKSKEDAEKALAELSGLIKKVCNAECNTFILNSETPEIEF